MGKIKRVIITAEETLHWHENMPDLMSQALADAERDFLDEADNMPLWIQLELDLWEGKHGIGTSTAWDLATGDAYGQGI